MTQHERFHLPVVLSAPVRPAQERPPDFDFTSGFVISMKPRRADHSLLERVERNQRAAGFQPLAKEHFESIRLIPFVRMLLPNQRVGRDGVQVVVVSHAHWPQFDEVAFQRGLEIE